MAGERRSRSKLVAGVVAVLLLIAAAGVGGWLLGRHHGAGNTTVAGGLKPGVPKILTAAQVRQLGAEDGPLYWVGERPGTKLEVTLTSRGGTYIRYLPDDAEVGTKQPYLTIGTYDAIDGYSGLAAAKKSDAEVVQGSNGAVIATFKSTPNSTYFAFPNGSFQVEVFSPNAGEARDLTDKGTVRLVDAS